MAGREQCRRWLAHACPFAHRLTVCPATMAARPLTKCSSWFASMLVICGIIARASSSYTISSSYLAVPMSGAPGAGEREASAAAWAAQSHACSDLGGSCMQWHNGAAAPHCLKLNCKCAAPPAFRDATMCGAHSPRNLHAAHAHLQLAQQMHRAGLRCWRQAAGVLCELACSHTRSARQQPSAGRGGRAAMPQSGTL